MKPGRRYSRLFSVVGLALLCCSMAGCSLFWDPDDDSTDGVDVSAAENTIGKGYDVFTYYADQKYVLSPVLNFDKLEAAGLVEKTALNSTKFSTAQGESSETYQADLAAEANLSGSYRYFSGSLKASFSSSLFSSSDNQFATILATVEKSQYALSNLTEASTLKNYLSDTFKEAVNDDAVTPRTLFETYGTHVITGIVTGGRFDYHCSARKTNTNSSTTIGLYAAAKYKETFSSASASFTADSSTADTTAFSLTETNVSAVGGESDSVSGEGSDGVLSTWLSSLTDDNVVFCDFVANGLMPIWKLCDDAERAREIEDYYDDWEDIQYDSLLGEDTATLTVTVNSLYNHNYTDSNGACDMLYDFRVKSSATQETKSIVAETEEDGPGELYMYPDDRCSFSAASASFTIPLNTSNTVTIIPQLEEDDNADLNNSTTHNDPNDLFCTTIGPFFNFTVKNRTLVFSTIDGQNASNAHFSMNAGTTTANENMTIALGESKDCYLTLFCYDPSDGQYFQWAIALSWIEDE